MSQAIRWRAPDPSVLALDNPLALVVLAGGVVLFIATVILWLRLRARMQGRR